MSQLSTQLELIRTQPCIRCALTTGMSSAFDYLDETEFRTIYCPVQEPPQMKFYIEGIKCSKCVSKIENLKSVNPELLTLDVDLAHQTATVELKGAGFSFANVAQAIDSLGFKAIPLQPQDDPSQEWTKESRLDLIRLAVAGFCAGNIMTFAFAVYFGVDGVMRQIFEYAQFFLYLPVVAYVALPFYKGLIQGIKERSISIDGPMAIASFMGFAVSTWNLFRGEGSIYFDSTSGFLFLILATRYVQKRTRFEFLKYLRPQSLSETFKARLRSQDGGVKWVPSHALKINDIVAIEKEELVPADGELLSATAILDLSVLDGESRPKKVQKGFPIKAGSKLLSGEIEMLVQRSGTQTMLGQLLTSLKAPVIEDTDSSTLSNQASQWLLGIVLGIAWIVLGFGLFGDFETYFERAFALIVLACPCAMAFGTPLALSFTMKRAQEAGIVVKSARVFENLMQIKTVFFDKTGTLTDRTWSLSHSSLIAIPLRYQQIILALESGSLHPIAFALREMWKSVPYSSEIQIEDSRALFAGVQGRISGEFWQFTSFKEQDAKWFGLFQDGNLVWKFQLSSQIRPGVQELIQKLQKRDLWISLLSGDNRAETDRVVELLDLNPSSGIAELTPQKKAHIIKACPNSLMVGDGVNDSLALKSAKVGIAVQGGVDVALKSADVLLLNDDLNSIIVLMELAEKAQRQIKRNLILALVYNTIGGIAAVLGFINPFVAALLMPISSLVILGATWWGTRR